MPIDPATLAKLTAALDAMTAEAEAEPKAAPLDMDLMVQLLKDAGIYAYVEHTGGGCATIYIGNQTPDPEYPPSPRYELVAGPGWFEGPDRRAYASPAEFYIGRDDDGETPAWDSPGNVSEAYITGHIIHTITRHRAASQGETAAVDPDREDC
ncbi:hypothetical protein AB0M47_20915 [Hamadaea sp. NPDC051192]|uniref:hypothetical protein n=1 Tax=Hamadaea sp. NPDC051192 TaxID=3154940 RepID=UPI0034156E99